MKNKVMTFGRDCWQMLTEIPGWPDAPKKVRLRRALPILIPCAAILLLLAWNKGVRDPYIARERASHQALLEQDREIESLRLGISEQQIAELTARTALAERQTIGDPKELSAVLANLTSQAAAHHWEGSFQESDLSTGAVETSRPESDSLTFFPARAKLVSKPGDPGAFSSLLALLGQFSESEKRIDLTRLGIRADEQGRYTAEFNLRLVGRSIHEKTPQ